MTSRDPDARRDRSNRLSTNDLRTRWRTLGCVALALAAPACAAPTRVAPRAAVAPAPPKFPWEVASALDRPPGAPLPTTAPPQAVLVRGATLWLATGRSVARGSILLRGGRIEAVAEGDLDAPAGARVIDGTGKFVTPGIIDTHSHLGVYPWPSDASAHADGNEMTEPVTAFARAADAFWPFDPALERAARGGITSLQILPGSGNLVGGRAATLKLRVAPWGSFLPSVRDLHPAGAPDGLKMACGENPKRVYGGDKGRAPMTRMGNLALQRAAFLRARERLASWERWREAEQKRLVEHDKKLALYEAERANRRARGEDERGLERPAPGEPTPMPDRDPGLETLIGALTGHVLVHVHCYRADDMLAMLALGDELGFRVRSFHHALEAYKIRGELARRGVSVSTWADWWGFKLEAYDGIEANVALVHEAGGRAIVHSDSAEGIQRLNQEAGKALAAGRRAGVALGDEDAIRWITANAAWALGIEARTGTLEVGKEADVVMWDKHPLSVYAKAELVLVDGHVVVEQGASAPPRSDFELGQGAGAMPLSPATPSAEGGR